MTNMTTATRADLSCPCPVIRARALFLGVCVVLFAASVALTLALHAPMAAMGAMPMPGGWSMPMTWLRPCGQSELTAAASFLGMWAAMTVSMMLPSVAPALWRYCEHAARSLRGAAFAGAGYFAVWFAAGAAVYALGVTWASLDLRWTALARATPAACGVAVTLAGALQSSRWKARHLACCRRAAGGGVSPCARAGWAHGVHLGVHCALCCAGFNAALLAMGIMDLRVMTLFGVAITAERLAPSGERVAKCAGVALVLTGLVMIARAARLA